MILSKKELKEYFLLEGKNYQSQIGGLGRRFWMNLFSNPICEQKYIWLYIKTLRLVEYLKTLKIDIKYSYRFMCIIYISCANIRI